tara:strand:- start:576 stop:4610 length:4035 start_codon:yes stop_codon:yes gene_type:complete
MEYQTSPFEPIRNFDVPGVLFNQIIENQFSLETFNNTILPSKRAFLTPDEQESLTEKLKEQYGGESRIARAAIGIATNPWIWLGFMISPAGARNIKTAGSIFAPAARQMSKGIFGEGGIFQALGALTSHQILNGTVLGTALETDTLLRKKAYALNSKHISESLSAYYKKNPNELTRLGITKAPRDLDEWLQVVAKDLKIKKPKKVTHRIFNVGYKGPHKELADNISRLLALELQKGSQVTSAKILSLQPETTAFISTLEDAERFSRIQPELVGAFEKRGAGRYVLNKDSIDVAEDVNRVAIAKNANAKKPYDLNYGRVRVVEDEQAIKPLIDSGAFNKLKKIFHIDALAQAHRTSYDERLVMLMGDEVKYAKTKFNDGVFHFDDDKLSTLAAAFQPSKRNSLFVNVDSQMFKEGQITQEGMDLLRSVVPLEEINIFKNTKGEQLDVFKDIMKSTVSHSFKEKNYLPRNTYGVGGDDLISPASGKTLGELTKTTDWKSHTVKSAETISDVNRLTTRSTGARSLTPEDYDWLITQNQLHGGGSATTEDLVRRLKYKKQKTLDRIFKNAEEGAMPTRLLTLDGVNSHVRYMKDTSEHWSRHIHHKKFDPRKSVATGKAEFSPDMEVYGEMVVVDEAHRANSLPSVKGTTWDEAFKSNTLWRSGGKHTDELLSTPLNSEKLGNSSLEDIVFKRTANSPQGGVTLGDIMSVYYSGMKNGEAAAIFKDVILPHISARKNPVSSAMRAAQISTAKTLEKFANGWMGQQIEKVGTPGKEFVRGLKELSTDHNISSMLAKGLYVGFLGANMSSVMLNMMQPFLHTTMQLGFENVIPAYGKALGEMFSYAKERIPLGMQISEAKRAELMTKHFTHVGEGLQGDLIGLLPDVFANIEGASYAGIQAYKKEGKGKFLAMTLPMKMFEKAELLNRLTAAHAVDMAFKKTGRRIAPRPTGLWDEAEKNYFRKIMDTKRFVQETQFGGTAMNMPTAFLGDKSPLSGVLSNPLGRQFLSFLARSFTSFAVTGKQINPNRFIRGTNIQLPGGHLPYDLMRAMGAGSLVYELGKEIGHTDLSRGLGAQPLLEVMGGGWVPPVVQLPYDLVKLSLGDLTLAETSLPAILPGGISAVRAMGMMPQLGKSSMSPDWTNNLQKTYVDWKTTTPEGMHPVFKADGSLINYEKPFSIIMKGLGVNLENHPRAGEVDGYLVNQRNLIIQMETDYLNAMLANNISKARGIEKEFKKKFNVPLKISKNQWRSKLRNLETARTERIANTIPKEYKHLYQSTVASEHQRLGLTEQEVNLGNTSTQRTNEGAQRTSPVQLDPETVKEIIRHMKEQKALPPVEEQGFNPFAPWNK